MKIIIRTILLLSIIILTGCKHDLDYGYMGTVCFELPQKDAKVVFNIYPANVPVPTPLFTITSDGKDSRVWLDLNRGEYSVAVSYQSLPESGRKCVFQVQSNLTVRVVFDDKLNSTVHYP